MTKKETKKELVGPWRNLHGAVWLIGLAVLFWKGWFWPGILILVALSTILEIVIMGMFPDSYREKADAKQEQSRVPDSPEDRSAVTAAPRPTGQLPANCPKCGAPTRGHEVKWIDDTSAECSFCGASLPLAHDKNN